jgi:purine-nucleoside/S-methyl-5'-thioadenosine phosphorylase / adenosine deaminase
VIMNNNRHWLEPNWPAPDNVRAITTLRSGGVSTTPYTSLNPALHVGDNAEHVFANREIIQNMLVLPAEPIWLQQVHSNVVVDASSICAPVEADASFCNKKNVVCAVLTADCLPVLMCSDDGTSVAAIHAGWRGLLAGVITNTVRAMQSNNLMVWLGPAIGKQCFEVGQEVKQAFIAKSEEYNVAFYPLNSDKWLVDIYQLARINLAFVSVDRVYGGGFCTVTDSERFYSYRRDKVTGRMATLIWRA